MSDIQDIERDIRNAEDLLGYREMAIKLYDNREFRTLFVDGYFLTEAARLVQLSGDPRLDVNERLDTLHMAQATGHAKRYLSTMVQMGARAAEQLPQLRATLEELRAEDHAE